MDPAAAAQAFKAPGTAVRLRRSEGGTGCRKRTRRGGRHRPLERHAPQNVKGDGPCRHRVSFNAASPRGRVPQCRGAR
jgi:hypothetical protein